jgi:hypothetical protein
LEPALRLAPPEIYKDRNCDTSGAIVHKLLPTHHHTTSNSSRPQDREKIASQILKVTLCFFTAINFVAQTAAFLTIATTMYRLNQLRTPGIIPRIHEIL